MGDESVYIFYVIILAIVAIATLIRKAVEKATSGEKGKRINLAQVVQRELRKYMGAPEKPVSGPPAPPPEQAARPQPTRPLVPALVVAPPEARPRVSRESDPVRRLVDGRVSLDATSAAPSATDRAHASKFAPTLDRAALKKAVVMAEVLGPPTALREDYRLF